VDLPTAALLDRHVDELTATLAGKILIAISTTASERWLDAQAERPLLS
jgi:hypothetical protein